MELRRQDRTRSDRRDQRPPALGRTLSEGLLVFGAIGLMAACGGPQEQKMAARAEAVSATSSTLVRTKQQSDEACGDIETGRRAAKSLVDGARRLGLSSKTPIPAHKLVNFMGTGSMVALESGVVSGGQVQVGLDTESHGGKSYVHARANVVGEQGMEYCWFFYNEADGRELLLNPRYQDAKAARYIGVVWRDAELSDGTRGDFVVKVGPDSLAGIGPEGKARPEDVLFRLEPGRHVIDTSDPLPGRGLGDPCEHSRRGNAPEDTVEEFAPTRAVVLIRQR